jgi:hypothetical protein
VFWLGDLNYRIPLPDAEVKSNARALVLAPLLAADQLHTERAAGRVFVGFEEPAIAFPPTYKYDPGTDDYDSSEKMRTPAWCDRVLRYTVRASRVPRCGERQTANQTQNRAAAPARLKTCAIPGTWRSASATTSPCRRSGACRCGVVRVRRLFFF